MYRHIPTYFILCLQFTHTLSHAIEPFHAHGTLFVDTPHFPALRLHHKIRQFVHHPEAKNSNV